MKKIIFFLAFIASFANAQNTANVSFSCGGGSAYLNFTKLIYVNSTNPNTATIFDTLTPPTVNGLELDSNSNYAYIGTDGKTWVWNGSNYISYSPAETTEWRLSGSTTDAQSNKTANIWRTGGIGVGVDKIYGNVTATGGSLFTPATFPPRNVASLGLINYGANWFGNGFMFTNNTVGNQAFSMVFNSDKAFFGRLNATGVLSRGWSVWSDVGVTFNSPEFNANDAGTTPSARLIVNSSTQGFLPPRMTTAQINAIANPATGLVIFNTTLDKLCVRESTGWKQVTTTAM